MENEHLFKLIDGSFSVKDSREILLNVFSGKILFHQSKNFSSQERFGKVDETAVVRIPQLKKTLEEILELLAVAEKTGGVLEITSEVKINFIPSVSDI